MNDTLIKGGRIITATDDYHADVLLSAGRIALIGEELDVRADRVIDARGQYVIPGAVDMHTHLEMPFGGTVTCDDFTTGTVAAVHGGTTAVVDFCIQERDQSLPDALATWHEKIERCRPLADVGFHLAVTDLTDPARLEELAALPEHGVTSIKLFMAYKGAIMVDDETLFRTMQVAGRTGSVVMVHAENGDAIDVLVREALAAGNTDPIWHARTRPPITEAEATSRAIDLAALADCPLYVVHVSCAEALAPVQRARAAGAAVWAETCSQYLYLDETYLARPDFEGAKAVFTPPAREAHQQEALWRGLETGVLSVVSSDHCAFRFADQKALGRGDFSKIPNGAPGIEDRVELLHETGVRSGRLTLNQWVELTSTAPARLFGMPAKGTIAVGADADVVVFDPERTRTISAATHHSAVDYNLYEGTAVRGGPSAVFVRGTLVVRDGELVGEPGTGRFVARERFGAGAALTAA
ncbi:dihydropyrimidinase [Svornostia abyssi]|uniref:Dihydropyrimidinase n=1 Tax=Svornostia abyssi TaxID=2898438 RepID=A0ABY5P9Z8_9ACTN|nr:dihydropyrimidinase [Parviterribacteraceae bacterium J379]